MCGGIVSVQDVLFVWLEYSDLDILENVCKTSLFLIAYKFGLCKPLKLPTKEPFKALHRICKVFVIRS